jgi:hypothetical protein
MLNAACANAEELAAEASTHFDRHPGACCVIDKWPSRVLSVKLSLRGRRANAA